MSYSLNTASKFSNVEVLKTQLDNLQTYIDSIQLTINDTSTLNQTNISTLNTVQTTVDNLDTAFEVWKYKSGTIHKIYDEYISTTNVVTLNSAVYQYFSSTTHTRELTTSRILVEVSFQTTLSGLTGNEAFFTIFDNVSNTSSQVLTQTGPNYTGPITLRWWADDFEAPGASTRTNLDFSIGVSSFNNVGLLAIKQVQWCIYEVNV